MIDRRSLLKLISLLPFAALLPVWWQRSKPKPMIPIDDFAMDLQQLTIEDIQARWDLGTDETVDVALLRKSGLCPPGTCECAPMAKTPEQKRRARRILDERKRLWARTISSPRYDARAEDEFFGRKPC
jgi:hypothetical protein